LNQTYFKIINVLIDINMDCLLDMYDHLKIEHEDMGFMNQSKSSEFVNLLIESIIFNDIYNEHSSDDES